MWSWDFKVIQIALMTYLHMNLFETNSLKKIMAMTIDTTNLCSHLQKKLFEPEGVYYPIWQAMQNDEEMTAVVRSRQLHIYRNGKKILILAGKALPKIIREDKLNELIKI